MTRPLYQEDESYNGEPLDLLHPELRYDPRALGYMPKLAMREFFDVGTLGSVTEQTELVPLRYALTRDREFWDQVGVRTPFGAQIILAEGPQPDFN